MHLLRCTRPGLVSVRGDIKYAETMHIYLSVVLVELAVLVFQADKESFITRMSPMVAAVAAEITVLRLHCVTDHLSDKAVQDRYRQGELVYIVTMIIFIG